MASARSLMTFGQAISTAFGNGLTLRCTAVAIFHQAFLFQAITAAFSYVLTLWGAVVAIFGDVLALRCTVVAIFGNVLALRGAIIAVFGNALALWSTVITVGSDFVAFDQAIRTAFGQGLGEHAVAGLDLWGGLFSGWQGEGVGSQNR